MSGNSALDFFTLPSFEKSVFTFLGDLGMPRGLGDVNRSGEREGTPEGIGADEGVVLDSRCTTADMPAASFLLKATGALLVNEIVVVGSWTTREAIVVFFGGRIGDEGS